MNERAPFDFYAFFDMVIASPAATAEKLIALIHARQMSRRKGVSHLSRSKVQEGASISDRTYQRALPVVRVFFDDTQDRGRATVWRPRLDITEESIEEAILSMRDTPKVHDKSIRQNGVYSKSPSQNGIECPSQNGAYPTDKLAGHKERFKEEEKKDTPTVPNPESVWLGEDGIPCVVNGKRIALEKILGGKATVDDACQAVAPNLARDGDLWGNLVAEIAAYAGAIKPKRQRQSIPETYSDDFEHFWKLYPRPTGKAAAFKAWQRLSLTQKRKAYASLRVQVPDLTSKLNDKRGNFCPHPATWINGGRFDDDVTQISQEPDYQKFYDGAL